MKKILTSLILTALTLCLTSCAETKTLHCDGCEKEVTVKESSNMTEEWVIFCSECEAKENN